jgi:hypothetical protein
MRLVDVILAVLYFITAGLALYAARLFRQTFRLTGIKPLSILPWVFIGLAAINMLQIAILYAKVAVRAPCP